MNKPYRPTLRWPHPRTFTIVFFALGAVSALAAIWFEQQKFLQTMGVFLGLAVVSFIGWWIRDMAQNG